MKKVLIVFLGLLLFGCGNIQKVDTTAMREQMNNNKIVRISNADIISQADIIGKFCITKINQTTNCDLKKYSSLEKMSLVSIEELKGMTFDNNKEKEISEAYIYGFEKNEIMGGNIQILNDSIYLYSCPISKNSHASLECGKSIAFLYLNKRTIIKALGAKE